MIPFDIEKAKAGTKVFTRDGREVEILRYDMDNKRPILAIVKSKAGEQALSYFRDGRLEKRWVPTEDVGKRLLVVDRSEDLMMKK